MSKAKKGIHRAVIFLYSFLIIVCPVVGFAQDHLTLQSAKPILVSVPKNLDRLIEDEDTDRDKKITIDDTPVVRTGRGDKRVWVISIEGKRYEVVGTYYLSNLLKELKLAQDAGNTIARIYPQRVFESPVRQISRSIRELYWDGLTRRVDEDNLEKISRDEKITTSGYRYVYVPHTDELAHEYFTRVSERHPEFKVQVERLPAEITPEYVKSLDGKHGILTLGLERKPSGEHAGVPFVVPGGRFNEMYGWDSYFEALGLLVDGRVDLAKAMVDNFVYQITHYGKILNANRTYYLTRSQPPFLTSMALAVYESLPKSKETKAWLKKVFSAAVKEYYQVWMNEDHLTETGLSRYYGSGLGPPPEVEPGHFDAIYRPFAEKLNMSLQKLEQLYKAGEIEVPELDEFFIHDRSVRESGHDTTYRWEGFRCADFVTVDLNSLLYKIEIDIARVIDQEFGGKLVRADGSEETSSTWYERAKKRKTLIKKYLWDEQYGMFFDYDLANKRRYAYVSATTFYPLWACHKDNPMTRLVTQGEAERLAQSALPLLEMAGGVAASAESSRGPVSDLRPARQWDYPNGWAPHQMLIWRGLLNYGFDEIVQRLIYRWLYTITRNAVDYNGTIPEKLDVVKRSHQVFAEYGNVGTKFAYITKEGFGWMNASYQVGLKLLLPDIHTYLERLIPPEWLFER
ncbi:MAG: trehalase family glycosidase [Candidatus Hodarchaeota archaeon]